MTKKDLLTVANQALQAWHRHEREVVKANLDVLIKGLEEL